MDTFLNKKKILLMFIVSFYFLIFGNWVIEITSSDEGKNAVVILNMMKTKNFLIPYYNCEPRLEKPPFLYWISSTVSSILGVNEFSLRLISGLSAVGIIIFMYLIAKEFMEESIAFKSILIFLTLPHVWIEARSFTPEMLLNFFSVGSIYLFLKEKTLWGWIFLALSLITKGPVGIILSFTIILFLRFTQRQFSIFNPLGILLFFALGSPWYLYMIYKFGYFYFYKFFLHENVFRYTGKKLFHPYPFYYYIIIVLITSFFYLPIYLKIFFKLKNLDIKIIKNIKPLLKAPITPFIFWFGFVMLFYSFSKNKLHHYILFAYPPLCIILANFVSEKYLKIVGILSGIMLSTLLILVNVYEKNNFTFKSKTILRNYEGEIYFYKSDVSSIPFYLDRCILYLNNPSSLKEGMVITKKKYENLFDNCKKIISASEFNERFILLECEKD